MYKISFYNCKYIGKLLLINMFGNVWLTATIYTLISAGNCVDGVEAQWICTYICSLEIQQTLTP